MYTSLFSCSRIFILLVTILLLSCGQGNDSNAKTDTTAQSAPVPVVYDTTLQKGVVIDTMVCRNSALQAYALYLPSYYTSSRSWPCIILFDAHARGALPLRMYKSIAEQYGFILVGSNVSKNGTSADISNNIINTLWDDVHARFNIDANRTYTSGFSGGSKIATIAAIKHGGIAGVIGCAGGLADPAQLQQINFAYFGIAGDYDFNQPDIVQLDHQLSNANKIHQLLTWQGIHAWPPAGEYRTAVLWLMINSMKSGKMPKNEAIVSELKSDYDKRIAYAQSHNDLVNAGWLLDGAARALTGVSDIEEYKKQLSTLVANASYKAAVAAMPQIVQSEQVQERELAGQFSVLSAQSWSQKIAGLKQDIARTKNPQVANAMHRTIAFLGFVGYMNVSRALAAGDLVHAESYLEKFKTADPKNPDCSYFAAVLAARKADARATIAALDKAAKLGYSDVEQLLTEPGFAPIRQDDAFLAIVQHVRDNHDGKLWINKKSRI